ncbi:hypothetical protein ACWCOP_08300 [Maricaulaceae bacterium MS644]
MMRLKIAAAFSAACAVAFIVSGSSFAQLPAPLEAALSVEARDLRPSSLDFQLETDGEGVTVRVDLADGDARYTLLAPSESDLTDAEREMWEGFLDPEDDAFREPDDDDGERRSVEFLGPLSLRGVVGSEASLAREADGLLIYSFTPLGFPGAQGEDESMAAMIEHLRGEIAVDPERGEPAWLHLFSTGSFKPHMVVRINDFSMRQIFTHEAALGGPRLARMEMALNGSAAFQRFEQSMVVAVSNMVFDPAPGQPGDLGEGAESP